ncbi:CBS domain-containing protein [Pseudobacteriovorax antillogorgiicola]|uniref:CBS domain-containing protein n=1 Tax=Pseudobacteriovorax antillogorgiicola TaxID=1513793 RepID=A0A1Y6CU24_9BACT|nr:CBS domain-containing protein [Pseudobacteriovorax antillogorgiicola]TCS45453.1 CBS domain protein [Pseudobacteriovorax antillogorgiicola]SMF74702.1 CBS domain-containing protein [Pseudobacteriovorax antillogorgiicola]
MKTSDVMTKDVITIDSQETVETAAKTMLKHNIGGLPVLEKGKIVGIITESDFIGKRVEVPHAIGSMPELLGHWFEGVSVESVLQDARKLQVREVMTKNLVFVGPETPLTQTVKTMMQRDLTRLPVLQDGKLVGLVARRDVLGAFDKLAD